MKAIILTHAPLDITETKLLKECKLGNALKIALNHHAEHLKPHLRLTCDFNVDYLIAHFKEKIVSCREFKENKQVINADYLEYNGSGLLCAVDFCISENFKSVLIVGDNTVGSFEFQEYIKQSLEVLNKKINIYQYSNGNFNLKVKEIYKYINE